MERRFLPVDLRNLKLDKGLLALPLITPVLSITGGK
jgi:hypothetical protein